MKIDNKKAKSIILSVLLLMCIMTPGLVRAQVHTDGLLNVGVAVMLPNQSKSFVASSDILPDVMVIPLYAYGTGVLNITIEESSPDTNLFILLERGTGYPNFKYRIGTSPRSMSISLNIYDEAFILIAGAILFSPEDGPYRFTIGLSFN
jgi:hypothetical protein